MVTTPFGGDTPLAVASIAGGAPALFEAGDAQAAEVAVLDALQVLEPGGVLVVDFDAVKVSSEAARQLLGRAIRRLRSGEIDDRFLVLSRLGSSRYNVEVMLQGEELAAVERTLEAPGARLIGRFEPAVEQTFNFLLSRSVATASELREALGLNSTQAAANRLAVLTKAALARRVTEQPLEGGGREYVYAAVH